MTPVFSKILSLKRNFFMNAVLTVSSFLFPLLTFPYVSRILLPAGYGRLSFASSVISYFTMFAQLGIPVYGIRACAQVRGNSKELSRTVRELLTLSLFTTALAYLFLGAVLLLLPRLRQERALLGILSLNLLLGTLGVEWLYKALEQYVYITLRSLLLKTLALAATFLLIHSPQDLLLYAGISLFASSASNLLNFLNLRRLLLTARGSTPGDCTPAAREPLRIRSLTRHLKAALIFFAMSCAATVYTNLDTVMLGFLKSDTQVGYYHAAVKIKSILVSLVTSLGAVLLPRASYYVRQGLQESFHRLFSRAFHFVLTLSLPLTAYFFLYAPEGIAFLCGPAYVPAILPMRLVLPTLILIGLTNLMGMQILVPTGRETAVLISVSLGALVNLCLNLLWIPAYACAGAAAATLAAETVVLLAQVFFLRDTLRRLPLSPAPQSPLLGTAVASLISLPVKLTGLTPFPALLLSACLFFSSYALVLLALRDPLAREVWQLLTRRGKTSL